MKKTTLTILALTLSLNAFACWGPKSGFWNDWNESILHSNHVKKIVVTEKAHEFNALIPVTISYQNILVSMYRRLFIAPANTK